MDRSFQGLSTIYEIILHILNKNVTIDNDFLCYILRVATSSRRCIPSTDRTLLREDTVDASSVNVRGNKVYWHAIKSWYSPFKLIIDEGDS